MVPHRQRDRVRAAGPFCEDLEPAVQQEVLREDGSYLVDVVDDDDAHASIATGQLGHSDRVPSHRAQ